MILKLHPLPQAAHLKPPLTMRDCHPKTSNSHLTIAARHFSGDVRLKVERTLESKMPDDILKKPFEKMSLATYKLWTQDILDGNYKVVKVIKADSEEPTSPSESIPEDQSGLGEEGEEQG